MKRPMQLLAEDIALGLARELRSQWAVAEPATGAVAEPATGAVAEPARPKFFDLIVEEVTKEVVSALGGGDLAPRNVEQRRALRLQQVDNKLDGLSSRIRSAIQGEIVDGSSDSDSESDSDSDLEGSKYQNIESLIKYVESTDGGGGVKLVIMNFND